jgi:hypothetical protein
MTEKFYNNEGIAQSYKYFTGVFYSCNKLCQNPYFFKAFIEDATTLSITTFGIMALSIMGVFVTQHK